MQGKWQLFLLKLEKSAKKCAFLVENGKNIWFIAIFIVPLQQNKT